MSDAKVTLSLIAAVAENGIIGADNDMPWRLSTDLRRFKALTMGKPIIMGRRTFQSVGKALPGRLNIVVSRDQSLALEGAVVVASLEAAFDIARHDALQSGMGEIMVTGGGQIYAEAIGRSDRLYITHVKAAPKGDTRFPDIDESIWKVVAEERFPSSEKDSAETVYRLYERWSA